MILAIFFLSGWLSDRLHWAKQLKSRTSKIVNHQVSVWIHRLNFVVIALIWLHVNVIPRIANVPYFTIVFDIYTVIFIAIYFYKKFITDADMKNSGEVIVNESLTTNIQKLSLKLNKYAKVGDFTKNIDQYSVGTKVYLEGLYGLFDQEVKDASGPIILYTLGTGIAPLLSLAQEYTDQKKLHLIWSTNNQEDYFTEEMKTLQNKGLKVDKKQHRYSIDELKQIISNRELS